MNKKWLILGHSRGGTTYITSLFKENGIDIEHEKMGNEGTCNRQFAVQSEEYPFTFDFKRQDFIFENIIHVMRNPILSINSIAKLENASEEFRKKFINIYGNKYERAILSYSGWHKLILSQKPNISIQVEKAKDFFNFKNDSSNRNTTSHDDYIDENTLEISVDKNIFNIYMEIKQLYYNL